MTNRRYFVSIELAWNYYSNMIFELKSKSYWEVEKKIEEYIAKQFGKFISYKYAEIPKKIKYPFVLVYDAKVENEEMVKWD